MSRSEARRPDISRSLALLRAREAGDDLQDVLLSLLRCGPEDATAVSDAIVERVEGEDDPLLSDALGEALGALWARHGAPAAGAIDRLPGVARTAARATYAILKGAALPEGGPSATGEG